MNWALFKLCTRRSDRYEVLISSRLMLCTAVEMELGHGAYRFPLRRACPS